MFDVTLVCEGSDLPNTKIEFGEIISVEKLVKEPNSHPFMLHVHVTDIPEKYGNRSFLKIKEELESPVLEASPFEDKPQEVIKNRYWKIIRSNLTEDMLDSLVKNREITIGWSELQGILGKRSSIQNLDRYDLINLDRI